MLPAKRALIELTHLKRNETNTCWIFRINLESIHAPFVENLMLELAKSELFRGGWFVGNWWFEDAGMDILSPLFGNWEEMKAQALSVESISPGTLLMPTIPEM